MATCEGVSDLPTTPGDLLSLCGAPLQEPDGGVRAYEVARSLGALGALWLRPEVLDRARRWVRSFHGASTQGDSTSEPPDPGGLLRRGEIGVLLALPNPTRYPLLRPAFVLPLEWRRGGTCSPRLPQGLAAFAAGVLADVNATDLSLHLPPRLEEAGADFSGLALSCESAWAMLAAGAIVAAEGGATVPGVLASAAWTRRSGQPQGSIGRVQRIAAKIEAAAASGATAIFLPEEQRTRVEQEPRGPGLRDLDIRYLSNAPATPARALAPLLEALEAAPRRAAGASFEQCCGYYTRAARSRQNDYYRDELLAELAARLRPALPRTPGMADVDGVVVIASPNWAVAGLVVEVFQPRRVLLLHDGRLPREVDSITAWLGCSGEAAGRVVDVRQCRTREGFADDLEAALRDFSARCSRIAVDLTAGYRHYMFALLSALPSNAVATYIDAQVDERSGAVLPATSEIRLLDLGTRPS